MLYAKINPVGKKVESITPFETKTTDLDYFGAEANPYRLGTSNTDFTVLFGVIVEESGIPVAFKNEKSMRIVLTASELEDWGTDDKVVLEKLAAKVGVTIVPDSYIEIETRYPGMI